MEFKAAETSDDACDEVLCDQGSASGTTRHRYVLNGARELVLSCKVQTVRQAQFQPSCRLKAERAPLVPLETETRNGALWMRD